MEDKRDEFVCILAGYTKEMNTMLDMNPGLRDRVQFYIDFPDYNEAELLEIFEKLCRENKYKFSQSAKEILANKISHLLAAKSPNFSNGRLMRKLFERTRMKQALRASNSTITDTDIEAVFAETDISTLLNGKSTQIGFKL
jgi:SpoVK/Ycf46/Vps4 family AAA+-type ATPase